MEPVTEDERQIVLQWLQFIGITGDWHQCSPLSPFECAETGMGFNAGDFIGFCANQPYNLLV